MSAFRVEDNDFPQEEPFFKYDKIIEHSININPNYIHDYKVDHQKSGFAIILTHKTYEANLNLSVRTSADIDKENAKKCFRSLDFDIHDFQDFTNRQILNLADEVSRWNHEDKDCLIVVISTHGADNGLIFSKNRPYYLERIVEEFAAIPSLSGKPKIFIVQACRGSDYDRGAIMQTTADSVCFQEPEETISIPLLSDCLIVYSSYEGFTSFRNDDTGSWFLSTLFKEFEENFYKKDILSLITDASKKVAFDFESTTNSPESNQTKQMPTIHSLLTRKLQFKLKNSLFKQSEIVSRITRASDDIPRNYEMNHKKRGHALFFVFENFNEDMKKKMRRNTTQEINISLTENIENLKKTFSNYGFNVAMHRDLQKSAFLEIISDVAKEDHSDSDCLAIIISTYGSGNKLFLTDELIEPYKIFDHFFGDNCPTLVGKPKLFFVNLSNGDIPTAGFCSDFVSLVSNKKEIKKPTKKFGENVEAISINKIDVKIPISADILIMYSSAFGLKFKANSSSFLMILEQELDRNLENKTPDELLNILTEVNRRVSWECHMQFGDESRNTKIIPRFVSSFTRHLYLTKKN